MDKNQIMVSVWCRTYNHVKYIRDALEGFISQRVNFYFQVVVFDDASTDGTSDIVREYAEKYPELIFAIIAEENTWHRPRSENYAMVMRIWEKYLVGKYISFCEGDDFWVDPYKLQLQVDYLEKHSECIMVCHDAMVIDYNDFRIYPQHPYFEERYLTGEEIIIQYHGDFPTASTTFRRELLYKTEMFVQCPLGDYTLELDAVTRGKIYFSPRIMSVYRSMHEGSWCRTHNDNIEQAILLRGNVINFLRQYDEYTNGKYHQAIIYKETLFIADCVNKCHNAGINEIGKFVQKCNEKTDSQYKKYFVCLEDAYRHTFEEDYCSASLRAFIGQYEHIYIWGAGKLGQRIARQLMYNNKEFEAFVVSLASGQEVMGKLVIGVDEISYPREKVGIIIAVNARNWNEIRDRFEKDGQFQYIYPYGVTEII